MKTINQKISYANIGRITLSLLFITTLASSYTINPPVAVAVTQPSSNPCPDGSDYDTIVVPGNASSGVVYNLRPSWPAGNYYVSIYSPVGLSEGGYGSYVWWNNTNMPTPPASRRVHGGNANLILGAPALFGPNPNTVQGEQRVYNKTHVFGGTPIDVPPGSGNVQTQVANNARYITHQVTFPANGWATLIAEAILRPASPVRTGDFRFNVGSLHFRVCPVQVVVQTYQCSDNIDTDGDGATDYPADFSCSSPTDNDEHFPKAQCQDGIDNDNDGQIDHFNDIGCTGPQDNSEFNQVQTYQCSDGIDNDNDGATDYPADFSCSSSTDNDEQNPRAQCQDGVDNDGDGSTDYPQDIGCSSSQDNNEFNQVQAACSTNSDCGNSSYVGSNFCQGNNVYRNFITYTCNNPGTAQSYCSNNTSGQFQQACSSNQTCSSGSCVNRIIQSTYIFHYRTKCSNNNIYWYDSNGSVQDLYKSCSDGNQCTLDSCGSGQCQNTLKCDGSTCGAGSADFAKYCSNTTVVCTIVNSSDNNPNYNQNDPNNPNYNPNYPNNNQNNDPNNPNYNQNDPNNPNYNQNNTNNPNINTAAVSQNPLTNFLKNWFIWIVLVLVLVLLFVIILTRLTSRD